MQKNCFCGRPARARHCHITTSTERSSGQTAKKLPVVAKTLLVMRLTFVLLTAAFLNVCANGVSQKISFSGEKVPLKSVFLSVKKQTGFVFLYTGPVLQAARSVTVSASDLPLEVFLNEVFKAQPLKYSIKGKSILVALKPGIGSEDGAVNDRKDGMLGIPPFPIKLRVVDAEGNLLAGASVLNKNTKGSGATDGSGVVSLNASAGDIISISFVGFESMQVRLSSATTAVVVSSDRQPDNNAGVIGLLNGIFTISLKRSEESLQDVEIVNKGYYEEQKRFSVSNTGRVTAKEIEKQPVTNALQALIGRTPGVFIQQGSGVPGGGFTLQIRGRNSVRQDGNAPLYLIDGVPFPGTSLSQGLTATVVSGNPLNAISPNDIESIDILKDADATAIYGSRGANGVVLITTKKAKAGKTRVEVNVSTGISKAPLEKMKLLNTQQYLTMRREAFSNDNVAPTAINAPDLMAWDTTRYIDWRKMLVGGTAHTANARAAVSGGTANTQFLVSSNYMKETTVFPGDFTFQRGGGHFSLNQTDNSRRFNMNLSATYTVSNNNLPQTDLMREAFTLPPNAPAVYDENGRLNWAVHSGAATWDNPFSYLGRTYKIKTNNINTNLLLSYRLLPFLQVKTTFGYSNTQNKEYSATRKSFLSPNVTQGTSLGLGESGVVSWIAEPQVEFQKKVGGGMLTALAGLTFNESITEGQRWEGTDFSSEILVNNISAAASVRALGTNYVQYRYNAVFARLGYNLMEKYLLNLTARRDGSSRFGAANQFGNFGAVGAAWIFSKEQWIEKNIPFLSFAKLRTSYGITGSDQIGDYRYLDTYAPTYWTYVSSGLDPVRLANPDYGWEVNKKFEAGLETGFLKDRILFSVSYFSNRSSNQLIGLPLPAMTGFEEVQINLPATVQNTGWEFEWQSTNIRSKNLTWTSSFNLTLPNSKLVSFPYLKDLPAFATQFVVGERVTTSQRYTYTGIDPATGNHQFVDHNGDNAITLSQDRKSLVNTGPRIFGGLNNSLRYKGLELSVFLQFVQRDYPGVQNHFGMPGTRSNQPVFVMDRWQKPGDMATYRRFSRGSGTNYDNWISSDAIITDISYIRLSNVSLSWHLPVAWATAVGMQSGRLYLRCQNLATITGYKGPDPETIGISAVPPLRTIVAGIQLAL